MELPGFVDITNSLKAGVYMLVYKRRVVYIGKSKCMLTRVYAHRSLHKRRPGSDVPKWLPVKGIQFDEIWVRPCTFDEIDKIERELIALYKPKFNSNFVGREVTMPITLKHGEIEITLNKPRTAQTVPYVKIERRI